MYVRFSGKLTIPMSTRYELVSAVLADVTRSGRPVITRTEDVDAEFGGADEFLLALHHRWSTAVLAHVDRLIEEEPADVESAFADLCQELAARQPALRLLLDAHAARPSLATAEEALRQTLRRDLGLTGLLRWPEVA